MLVLALSSLAAANCGPGSTSLSPAPGAALAPGAQIVLEASRMDRQRFEALRDGDVVLSSGDRRVPLRVLQILEGTFGTTQWVLVPVEAPEPGETWTVLHRGEPVQVFHDRRHQPASVTPGAAPAGPAVWSGTPQVVSAGREHFGCGPAPQVVVDVPVAEAPWVEATLRPLAGGDAATLRLVVKGGRVTLGHGMCSGSFELKTGVEYFVDLVAVDALGRRAPADDNPLRFTAP